LPLFPLLVIVKLRKVNYKNKLNNITEIHPNSSNKNIIRIAAFIRVLLIGYINDEKLML
jgi:hypothetical protein